MPELVRLGKVVVRMFADDHAPPHFHVITPDGEVIIRIDDFVILQGRISRRDVNVALEWAAANRGILENTWRRLNER